MDNNIDILHIADASAQRDLQILLKGKIDAQNAYLADKDNQTLRQEYIEAKRLSDAEEMRVRKFMPQSGKVSQTAYKTQLDAVAFLKDRGFKVSKSAFGRDLKKGKISTDTHGHFEESMLLAYALALKEPTARAENKSLSSATTDRLSADADLKKYQAERQKLKLEREQGLMMPKAEYERNLAARALFFKNEVRNFIHLHGAAMISIVEGEEAKLPALVRLWEEKTAIWMDTWSEEREFAIDAGDDDDAGAETGGDAAKNGEV